MYFESYKAAEKALKKFITEQLGYIIEGKISRRWYFTSDWAYDELINIIDEIAYDFCEKNNFYYKEMPDDFDYSIEFNSIYNHSLFEICWPLTEKYIFTNIFLIGVNEQEQDEVENGNILCFAKDKEGLARWVKNYIIPYYEQGDMIYNLDSEFDWVINLLSICEFEEDYLYTLEKYLQHLGISDSLH